MSNCRRHIIKILTVTMIVLILSAVYPMFITSQSIDTDYFAIQVEDTHINLYTVNETGNPTLLQALDGSYFYNNFRFNSEEDFQVIQVEEVKLSPDHRYLAFTAIKFSTSESVLFIYDIQQSSFQTIPTMGIGQVIWSPDNKKILLAPLNIFISRKYPSVEQVYVYDMFTNSLIMLTNDNSRFGNGYLWLPDSTQIIYVGSRENCETPSCLATSNLYLIDLQSQNRQKLTDLAQLSSDDLGLPFASPYECDATKPVWSTQNERIYFSLDCKNADDSIFSSLHSVTLNGDNRFEGHLMDLFLDITRIQILNIYPSATSDDIYISAIGSNREIVDGLTNILGNWSVIKNDTSQSLSVIASQIFDDISESPVFSSSLSPGEKWFALVGGNIDGLSLDVSGYLAILEIATGQITEYQTDDVVCNGQWQDTHLLRYQQFDAPCNATFRSPTSTWKLDISSSKQSQVNTGLDGTVWMLK